MDPTAKDLIRALDLAPHPEGGYFRETYRAPLTLTGLPHAAPRAAHTAIYFLLPGGSFPALHRGASDEAWAHFDGDAVDLHLIDEAGRYACIALGHDYGAGERPQFVVPAGAWQ